MLISSDNRIDDKCARRYYVGMTRAKKRLFIHTNCRCFGSNCADAFRIDAKNYDMPDEVVLKLSHKDVYLGYFMKHKREILDLRSGDALEYKDYALYHKSLSMPVAQLSARMKETVSVWKEKGYNVDSAEVRFIVAWKPKNSEKKEECAVLLADLTLKRSV